MEAKKRFKPVSDLVEVVVVVGGKISDGEGGRYPEGKVLSVPAATAESLRRQGFAK